MRPFIAAALVLFVGCGVDRSAEEGVDERPLRRNGDLRQDSNRYAREFRTRLREELATHGVNFAGAYSLVSVGMTGWGDNWYIVDRRTGKVSLFPYHAAFLDFKEDSNLIVMNSKQAIEKAMGEQEVDCYFSQPAGAHVAAFLLFFSGRTASSCCSGRRISSRLGNFSGTNTSARRSEQTARAISSGTAPSVRRVYTSMVMTSPRTHGEPVPTTCHRAPAGARVPPFARMARRPARCQDRVSRSAAEHALVRVVFHSRR